MQNLSSSDLEDQLGYIEAAWAMARLSRLCS
jgi:hypothetical protein